MRTENGRAMPRFRVVLAVSALLVGGVAQGADEEAPAPSLPVVVASPPAGCKKLGEVKGLDQRNAPSADAARLDALKEARKLGATHVKEVWAGRVGAWTELYKVNAYRCPTAPATGK